jgi:hypothetical protein
MNIDPNSRGNSIDHVHQPGEQPLSGAPESFETIMTGPQNAIHKLATFNAAAHETVNDWIGGLSLFDGDVRVV